MIRTGWTKERSKLRTAVKNHDDKPKYVRYLTVANYLHLGHVPLIIVWDHIAIGRLVHWILYHFRHSC